MKHKDVIHFEQLHGQLQAFYQELSIVSKKNPNDLLNKFKVRLMNLLLDKSNSLLKSKTPIENFTQFAEDELPSNSDALFVISQYLGAFEAFRSENIRSSMGRWYWEVSDANWKDAIFETSPPRRSGTP